MRMRSPSSSIVSRGMAGGWASVGVLERPFPRCRRRTFRYSGVISSRAEAIALSSSEGRRNGVAGIIREGSTGDAPQAD
jgi:hypothetical protein